MQKIIIDTDPGGDIDDLMAIWFAVLRPELDIKAITTVSFPTDKRARLVKRLLRYLDRTDIPVAAGMQFPFRSMSEQDLAHQYDETWTMNHYSFAEPEDSRDEPDNVNAVDLIIDTVEQYPGEIVLCCIAPLTNIACALCKKPDIASKIKYIAMMGGEVDLDRKEHNVCFDHVAADIVLNAGIPVYMGTWDITRRFVLSAEECDVFKKHPSDLSQKMAEAIDVWLPVHDWKPGPVMYDIFPMIWSYDRELYFCEQKSVEVEMYDQETLGQTFLRGKNTNIYVSTEIQEEKIKKLYLETVLKSS